MSDDAVPAPRGGFRALLAAIVDFAGPLLPRTLVVISLAAVLEGAGLVLLLPVAEVIFAQGENARSGVTADVVAWLAAQGFGSVIAQLAVMGTAFMLLVLLRAIVLLRRDVLIASLAEGFVDHVRRRFFDRLAEADWPVIKRFRKAQLLNSMTTNIGRLAVTMHALASALVTAIMALAYLAAAFVVNGVLGLALLLLAGAGLVGAVLWTRRSHRLGQRLNLANRGVMDETTRFLDGLKAAKAARAEVALSARFAESIAETRAIAIHFVMQQARLRNAVQVIAALGALVVLLLGFGLLGLTGGELLVVAAIVLRLAPNLVASFGGLQSIAHALPAFEAIRELGSQLEAAQHASDRREEGEIAPATPASTSPATPLVLEGARVDVRSDVAGAVTLLRADGISIAPGTLVHISGPSGGGKSTLVELIAGLHFPAAGSVRRGAFELSTADRESWQAQVSFAPQEPFLFDGNVRENLLWPDLSLPDEALWDALERVEATQVVRDLPDCLDEELLDGGARLSGGERQRLCLARALLRPASLLVLDEATSAMDPELERRIVARLKAEIGHRIILLVSHSLNAAGHADQRIEVMAGVARSVACADRLSDREI